MSIPTTNRNWAYPTEYLDPHYTDFFAMFQSIDQDVQDLYDAIATSGIRRRAVIDIVDCTLAPPTEVTGDRYILDFTSGTIHADWDGADRGEIAEFGATAWTSETPEEGWNTFVDLKESDYRYIDDGTATWEKVKTTDGDFTTGNMAIYVNVSTGSDTTGTGTASKPYATITKAYEDVPHLLKHPVQIKIAAGTYTDFPLVIEHECEDNGQLVFDGGDISSDAGPFTVAIVTAVNTLSAQDILVSGAGWTPNQFQGKFAKITSGTNAGYYLGIISNTTDTLRVINTRKLPSAPNTFEIGYPLVDINLGATDIINARVYDKTWQYRSDYMPTRLGIGFINFNVADSLVIRDTPTFLPCCDLNLQTNSLDVVNCEINGAEPFPDVANAFAVTYVNDYGVLPFIAQQGASKIDNSHVLNLIDRGDPCYPIRSNNKIERSHLDSAYLDGSKGEFQNCHFELSGDDSITLINNSFAKCFYCHFEAGDNCLNLNHSSAVISNGDSTSANYTYGVRLKDCSKAIDHGVPSLSGASGDVYFYQTNTVASHPSAGAAITDNQGSFFVTER
jgi:hypothetical protein